MRVFDSQGSEVAGEFRVNEAYVSGSQYEPALASLSNGNFIVTWRDSDGSSHETVREREVAMMYGPVFLAMMELKLSVSSG